MAEQTPTVGRIPAAEQTMHGVIVDHADRAPDTVAVSAPELQLTYGQLLDHASGVAGWLASLDVPTDRPVAVTGDRGAEVAIASFGVLLAGRFLVNVDPYGAEAARDAVIGRARPVAVVGPRRLLAPWRGGGTEEFPHLCMEDVAPAGAPGVADAGADAPMWAGFTSGTTGTPKGLLHLHRTDLHMVRAQPYLQLGATDRYGMVFTGSFTGLVGYPFWALAHGGTLCPFDLRHRSADAFGTWLQTERVTVLHGVPTMLRDLLARVPQGSTFPDLRLVYLGGEALSWDDVAFVRSRVGPHVTVANVAGATEVGPYACHLVPSDSPIGTGPVPVGHPLPGTDLRLVDDRGDPVAPGEIGRLIVRSRYVAGGTWPDPAVGADAFRAISAEPGALEVRLADLLRRDERGLLWHAGRSDHVVKVGGARVDLDVVEAEIRGLDAITDAAVVPTPDGQGLVAFVAVEQEHVLDPSEVRRRLAERLPVSALPRSLRPLDRLPRLSTGKADRQALTRRARPTSPPSSASGEETVGDLETRLAGLWASLLGLNAVRPDADWFELGGSSIAAARLVVAIEERFGVSLSPAVLLDAPRVRDLARVIHDDGGHAWPTLVPLGRTGTRPPLFAFHALFGNVLLFRALADHLGDNQPVVGVQSELLEGWAPRWRTLEEMAAGYRGQIVARFPEGPYLLFGQSFGGTLAFEVARQLHAEGREVGLVAMGDTACPARTTTSRRPGDRLLRLDRLRATERTAWRVTRRAAGRAAWHMLERVRALQGRWAVARGQRVPARIRGSYVRSVNLAASRSYTPGELPLPVVMLRSLDPDPDDARGWGPWAGDVITHRIEAFHDGIVREPAVAQTAVALREHIDQYLRTSSIHEDHE